MTDLPEMAEVWAERVAKGESKRAIYSEYAGLEGADRVARKLAVMPSPAHCKQYTGLNYVLAGLLLVEALVALIGGLVLLVAAQMHPAFLPIFLFWPAVVGAVVFYVLHFSAKAYLAAAAVGIWSVMSSTRMYFENMDAGLDWFAIPYIAVLVGIFALALHLRQRLFPALASPRKLRKGEDGIPLFEN